MLRLRSGRPEDTKAPSAQPAHVLEVRFRTQEGQPYKVSWSVAALGQVCAYLWVAGGSSFRGWVACPILVAVFGVLRIPLFGVLCIP